MSFKSNTISPARTIALELLNKILISKKPFEHVINSSEKFNNLESKNKRFCRLIITIVLRKFGQIDFVLYKFIKKGSIKRNIIKNIIRIGIAEVLFIKSAKYAAINDAVELTKIKLSKNLSKLTNAVLRNIDRESEKLISELNNEMNYPEWLINDWKASWGERQTDEILKWFQTEPFLDISVSNNPKEMEKIVNGKLIFRKTIRKQNLSNPLKIPYFQTQNENYHWWIQDVASTIPADLLIQSDKINIVDLCAAPGGKTAQLAKAGKKVISIDINNQRIKMLKENVKRLNLKINIVIADGRDWKPETNIDAVLLDAPCSATGTIRRHPDIIKNRSIEKINSFLPLQSTLLDRSLSWLEKNGILIYSVCSLQKKEGEEQIKLLIERRKDVKIFPILPEEVSSFSQSITRNGWLRIFPNCLSSVGGNDGFFICRLQKL